jgi:hypothetical protein
VNIEGSGSLAGLVPAAGGAPPLGVPALLIDTAGSEFEEKNMRDFGRWEWRKCVGVKKYVGIVLDREHHKTFSRMVTR